MCLILMATKRKRLLQYTKSTGRIREYLKLERTHKGHLKSNSLLLAGLNKTKPYD